MKQQQQIATLLQKMIDFRCEAGYDDFIAIFGEALGPHIWGQFQQADNDLVVFYARLDHINRPKLEWAIEGWRCG